MAPTATATATAKEEALASSRAHAANGQHTHALLSAKAALDLDRCVHLASAST